MILTTRAFHELRRDTRGQVLVWGAVIVPALALFLGLSLDVGLLYDVRRRAQSAADGAAASGAMELARQTTSYVTSAALYDAGRNGFDNDETEVTVTVSNPPVSGPRLGDSNFVEVVVREDVDTYFMQFIGRNLVTVRARSVAGIVHFGDACLMALDPSASAAMKVNGSPTLNANCGVMVNSSDSQALQVPGSTSTINATYVGVNGGYTGSGSINPIPQTSVPPMVDPLAYMQPLDPAAYPPGSKVGDTYYPGVYSSEIKITGNKTITFEPGIYILRAGMRIIGGDVSGFGVGFFLTDEGGVIDISGTADVTFTAPSSGPMQGMLFFADPNAPNATNKIGRGNSTFTFTGSFYFPSMHLDWAGTPLGAGSDGVIIANTLDISGTSDVDFTNPDPDQGGATLMKATIVE